MKSIHAWATTHGVSAAALSELDAILNGPPPPVVGIADGSESAGMQRIRLEAGHHGVRLWRNNVGACTDERGNFIRYGLANESKALNEKVKSSDLIGITPYTVGAGDVGKLVGIFTAIECKKPGWTYKGTGREVAQNKFINLVKLMGGLAQFATDPKDIWK